jgi:superfamily I DNA/RNA helicase
VWPVFEELQRLLAERGIVDREMILRRAREAAESGTTRRYYSIVVDETQDMTAEALRFIRALAGDEHADDVFLVGDAHQRIYGRPVTLSSCGINVRGRRSRRLRVNYRPTESISRYALRILSGETFDDLDEGTDDARATVSLRGGPEPQVSCFDTLQDEQAFLAAEIRRLLKEGIPASHICITARRRDLIADYYEPALAAEGIDVEILGRDSPKTDHVRMATMHRVKGLEFPILFAAGVQKGFVPLPTSELDSDDPVVAKRPRGRQASPETRALPLLRQRQPRPGPAVCDRTRGGESAVGRVSS